MKVSGLIIALVTLFVFESYAQNHGLVHWKTFEEVEELQKTNPKPVLIDFYTDWCGWCKRMVATTYSDPSISTYINQHFYAIQFNAETHDTITYEGQTYTNPFVGTTTKGRHSLAKKLMGQKASYPKTLFINPDKNVPILVPGYLDPNGIAPFLLYYQENLYTSTSINNFRSDFQWTFESGEKKGVRAKKSTNWVSLDEAFALNNNGNSKKILVVLDHPESVPNTIMDSATFQNPVIAEYINENYHAVNFNVFSTDSVNINGNTLTGQGNGKFHQLVMAGTKNAPKFPCVLIFNEKNQLISPVPEYMDAFFMEVVLAYFKEDKYLEVNFSEFRKTFTSQISN